MNDAALWHHAYAILTAGPGWRTNHTTPKDDMSAVSKTRITTYFEDLTTDEQDVIIALFKAHPKSTEEWDVYYSPSTDVKVETGKHAAAPEGTSITVKRWLMGDCTSGMGASQHEASGESKGYGYDAPTFTPTDPASPSAIFNIFNDGEKASGVNEATSESIRSAGDLNEAINDAAVKATEESLEYLGATLGVDFDLAPGTVRKLVGESGISDAAAAFIAAAGDPFQPYKDVASKSRKKRFDAFTEKAEREKELEHAALAPLKALRGAFEDRVDSLDGNPWGAMASAPLNADALAEARTALAAVKRAIRSVELPKSGDVLADGTVAA